MKIIVDTNVLVSAMIFDGRVLRLLEHLLKLKHRNIYVLVSEYVDNEFRTTLNRKWPSSAEKVHTKYKAMGFIFCDSTPNLTGILRDPKYIPVLSDALYHNADIILTGDKDFLESGITYPAIYSPAMLADLLRL